MTARMEDAHQRSRQHYSRQEQAHAFERQRRQQQRGGNGPDDASTQEHRQSRGIDAAAIAPEDEHVEGQRGNQQRSGHEAEIEVDEKGNRDQPETESDGALKDRGRGHDGCDAGEQHPTHAASLCDAISATGN